MKRIRLFILLSIFYLIGAFNLSYAQTDRIPITGYGEINFNSTFGEKRNFYTKVLKMSVEDVEQYFVEKQISNAVSLPVKKYSENEVVDYIESNEGAIGYISRNQYDLVKDRVKAVLFVK